MTNTSVSAKISSEIARKIERSGFAPSDLIQVGLEAFFDLPMEQQENLILSHIQKKKKERALSRFIPSGGNS